MNAFLTKIITEPDNSTPCPIRILAIAGCLQYLGMTLYHFAAHHVFDMQGFGIGFATILGATGAALGMKKDSPK